MPSAPERSGAWRIGEWVVDPSDDTLTRGGDSIKLEPRMMRLLLCLASSPGTVLSQEHLLSEVWSGVVVGPASVYQSISQLRKVLGDTGSPSTYIETVARKGYRLIAPVQSPMTLTAEAEKVPEAATVAAVPARRHLRPLLALLGLGVLAVGGALLTMLRPAREARATVPSLVVLPLVDMTSGRTEQAFCDGLTEELSNWLAQIPMLRVVARTSAFAVRDRTLDVRQIGRELGTTDILEGSLRRSGNRVRVTVQLVSTRDGYHVWSGSYDAALTDVIQVQEQIARAVAANLELRLTDATTLQMADRRSASARAYLLYLLARHHQQLLTREDNEAAIDLYKQAITADPSFALAQIRLAYAYLNQNYFNDRPISSIAQDAQPLLDSAARRAPRLAELYVVRGALESEIGRRDAAVRDLQRAIALNPSSRDAAAELGYYHLHSGEPVEALRFYSRALELDPLDYSMHARRCIVLTDMAQFEAADAACARARALAPAAPWAYSASSGLEDARGKLADALKWNAAALEHRGDIQQAHAERGLWLFKLGLIDAASASYDASVAADAGLAPNPERVFLGLLTSYARAGQKGMHEQVAAGHLDASDDPEVLFELANAELIAGDTDAAQRYVERALATPRLRAEDLVSPWAARTGWSYLLIAAMVDRNTGQVAQSERRLAALSELLQRMLAAGVRRSGVYELQAQVAALRGDPAGAALALNRAADLGWRDIWLAEHEPYLASLRSRPEFVALATRIHAALALERQRFNAQAGVALLRNSSRGEG